MNKKLFFILTLFLIGNLTTLIARPISDPPLPLCQVTANFTAKDTCEGYPVQFKNTSTGVTDLVTFTWNFGDGSPYSTDNFPTHIYLNAGTYTVSLTATWAGMSPCSTISTKTVTIKPFQSCCANRYHDAIFPDHAYLGDVVSFSFNPDPKIHSGYNIFWNFGDNEIPYNEVSPTHIFSRSGIFPIKFYGKYKNEATGKECIINNQGDTWQQKIVIYPLSGGTQDNCCDGTFAPEPGKKYVLSAWMRSYSPHTPTYSDGSISVVFAGVDEFAGPFYPKGPIIDGWQRIEEEFTVPQEASSIIVNLNNEKDENVFFDDIRIFPTQANMKSYVYDPHSKRLMAELDQNNYATYYEYDEEGQLIRVKKETERGRMTIKESRSSTVKTNQE